MNRGKFIVIEGLEGAGKTTAQSTIAQVLNSHGIKDISYTREPGGTPLAEKLREIIKYGVVEEQLTEKAEVLLLYAARIQLVEHTIQPALNRGSWVIGDRHDLSSQAYQGGGRGIDANLLKTLRQLVLGDFKPDLIIYLDIPPELGLQRVKLRGKLDRIEEESLSFFERIRQRYLELIEHDDRVIKIDASQPLEQVSNVITTALQNWLKNQR